MGVGFPVRPSRVICYRASLLPQQSVPDERSGEKAPAGGSRVCHCVLRHWRGLAVTRDTRVWLCWVVYYVKSVPCLAAGLLLLRFFLYMLSGLYGTLAFSFERIVRATEAGYSWPFGVLEEDGVGRFLFSRASREGREINGFSLKKPELEKSFLESVVAVAHQKSSAMTSRGKGAGGGRIHFFNVCVHLCFIVVSIDERHERKTRISVRRWGCRRRCSGGAEYVSRDGSCELGQGLRHERDGRTR